MLPPGCDAVIPVERITVEDGVARIAADVKVTPGLNIHPRASDQRQGTLLLEAGVRLEHRTWPLLPARAWRACASASSLRSW